MSEAVEQLPDRSAQRDYVFQVSFWPFLLDFALRLALLASYYKYRSNLIFWTGQVIVIPLLMMYLTYKREEGIKKRYKIPHVRVSKGSVALTLVCLLMVLSSAAIVFSLFAGTPNWLRVTLTVLTFFVYGMYIYILHELSPQAVCEEDRLRQRTPFEERLIQNEEEDIDRNDLKIIKMERDMSSISHRVDTYTLESALFGALAFSGFLSLISSSLMPLAVIQTLIDDPSIIVKELGSYIHGGYKEPLPLNMQNILIAAVTIETLICSMLFMSVIVSRLRFYGVLERVDFAVRAAKAYNEKEEAAFNLQIEYEGMNPPQVNALLVSRVNSLHRKVQTAINAAEDLVSRLASVSNYMWTFRSLGIGSFLLILVTSASIISAWLAIGLIVFYILASVYSTLDQRKVGKIAQTVAQKVGDFFDEPRRPMLTAKRRRRRS